MAKSIGVQLSDRHSTALEHGEVGSASSSRSRTAVLFPLNPRDAGNRAKEALLAISSEQWRAHPEPRPVRLRIEQTPLMVSGSTKGVPVSEEIRLQTSPLAQSGPFQPQSTLRTYRSMAVLPARQDTVKAFEKGRNLLNRLEVQTAKEQNRVDSLTYLRGKVEDQRQNTLLRSRVRGKERKQVLREMYARRDIARTAQEEQNREKEEQEEKHVQHARMGVRRKFSPARSLLFINSLSPQMIPQAKERTFTLSDLQMLLTATQPKRFRFK